MFDDDLLVCGGGLTGLTVGALAAGRGLTCAVLEKSEHLGGRARSQRLSQALFNLGPHALYLGGPAQRVLRELGLPLAGRSPRNAGLGLRGGALHTLPGGAVTLLTSSLLPARQKPQLAALLARLGSLDPSAQTGRPLRAWLDETFSGQATRELLEMLIRVGCYCDAPALLDAGRAMRQLQRAFSSGVRYLDGGWQSLVDGVREVAQARGVSVRASSRVERVRRLDGGGFEVTLASGELRHPRAVVLAMNPASAAAMLEPDAAEPLRRWARESVPARVACLDLELARLPRPRATLVLGVDRPLYGSVHSAVAQLGAGTVVHLAKYLAPGVESGPAVERELELLMDQWQPGWGAEVRERRFLPHLTVAHAIPLASQRGHRPAQAEVPGVPGLFLTGEYVDTDWLLLDGAVASAELVVQRVVARQSSTQFALSGAQRSRRAIDGTGAGPSTSTELR